jgi:hypothetical protein
MQTAQLRLQLKVTVTEDGWRKGERAHSNGFGMRRHGYYKTQRRTWGIRNGTFS